MRDFSPERVCFDIDDKKDAAVHSINASLDGVFVGCAKVVAVSPSAKIASVDVEANYRGNKIGSLIIKTAVDRLKTISGVLSISTFAQNERTVKSFCGLFRPEQLSYWLDYDSPFGAVIGDVGADPDSVIDYLVKKRLREFGQSDDPTDQSAMLREGVGIRAHLL